MQYVQYFQLYRAFHMQGRLQVRLTCYRTHHIYITSHPAAPGTSFRSRFIENRSCLRGGLQLLSEYPIVEHPLL
jgi:hypothetical protein